MHALQLLVRHWRRPPERHGARDDRAVEVAQRNEALDGRVDVGVFHDALLDGEEAPAADGTRRGRHRSAAPRKAAEPRCTYGSTRPKSRSGTATRQKTRCSGGE